MAKIPPEVAGYIATSKADPARGLFWDEPKPKSTQAPDQYATVMEAYRDAEYYALQREVAKQGKGHVNISGFSLPVPKLRHEAMYGILGDIAHAGSLNSEAVPAALAINTLARFCATIGRPPHVAIGDERRSLRPFVLIVGPTAMGRKGTSAQLPSKIFEQAEALLAKGTEPVIPLQCETAVSSGEGLIWMVRDPKGTDPGVADKRMLLEISEFSGMLSQAKREASVLTAVIRDAFDDRRLTTPNKNNPCSATGAHFVTIGHITREEFTSLLSGTDIANGFANRFMMVYSARIKRVAEPSPTPPAVIHEFAVRVAHAINDAKSHDGIPIMRSEDARQRWLQISAELDSRVRASNVAKLMARASTYMWMLSAAIALLNREHVVEVRHLDAALAWIDYWEETADFCFTTAATYDEMVLSKEVADEFVQAVRDLGAERVKHSAVTERLSNNGKRKDRSALVIAKAVALLQNEAPPRIEFGRETGKGRTSTTYTMTTLGMLKTR